EATDDFLRIEAQILGIGPHEADCISRTRQVLIAAVLDGLEIDATDPELVRNGRYVLAIALARLAQQSADRARLQVLRHRLLAVEILRRVHEVCACWLIGIVPRARPRAAGYPDFPAGPRRF